MPNDLLDLRWLMTLGEEPPTASFVADDDESAEDAAPVFGEAARDAEAAATD